MEKDELTLTQLEEINNDVQWRTLGTVTFGLLVASLVLGLPGMLQDVIYEEIGLGVPVGAILIVHKWARNLHVGAVALISLVAAYGTIFLLATCAASIHHRTVDHSAEA